MADSVTLAGVETVALAEGVKFLYSQAGEALRRWRERRSSASPQSSVEEPVDIELPPDAFDGQMQNPRLHFDALDQLQPDLRDLRAAVADYAQGIDKIASPADDQLLKIIDALRCALEAVYGQQITFRGESHETSGPIVAGQVKADQVLGYVAGLRAKRILGGSAFGRAVAGEVASGGEVIGVDLDEIK